MIVIRLLLHSRDIRLATGTPAGVGRLYKTIATVLIESSALYAVNSLLFIGPWVAGNHTSDLFLPILAQTQVRTFPRLQSSDMLSNVATVWTGYRPTAHRSAARQQ